MRTIYIFLLVLATSWRLKAQINLHITGIRNASGSIRIQFFDSKEHFDDEKALFTKTADKSGVNKGTLTVHYSNIPPGTYGIAILDDENNNQKMDYGLLLPKEGFGFSDYYHTGMSRPDFNKFKFTYPGGSKDIHIRVRYL